MSATSSVLVAEVDTDWNTAVGEFDVLLSLFVQNHVFSVVCLLHIDNLLLYILQLHPA